MLIHRGLERVLCDLAEIGYDCEWQVIGADDVGAWHRRKRIWIVAYPQGSGLPERLEQRKEDHFNGTGEFLQREGEGRDEIRSFFERSGENVPYTERKRGKRRKNGVEGFETQRGKTVSRRGNTGKKKKSKEKKYPNTYRNGRDYGRKVAKDSNEGFSSGGELERGKSIKFHPDVSNSNGNGLQHSLERQDKVRLSSSADTQREGRGTPNSDSWDVQNGYHEPGVPQKEIQERLSEDVDGHSDNTGRVQGGFESRLGGMANGIPSGLDGYWRVEPPIPRVTEKKKHRIPRLKGLGNAIVPQVAAYIMYNIKNAEG
jgi:site-specific DNA-cytosine methylase